MHKTLRSWVVVADSARAQLFIPNEDETSLNQSELPGLVRVEVGHHSSDVGSDAPGRSFGSAGGGVRHGIEPRHDPHKQEKHKFAVALADALNRACLGRQYDRLVLVVPPRTLGELRQSLSQPVQSCMEVVAKDLTKASLTAIWSEVAEIVRHRPLTAH